MALFQRSVLEKYLKQQDGKRIAKSFAEFTAYFHNPERQANIREAKEEQFQEGFLRELFVKVLGYTLNPDPHFDLTTELKNEKGSKKADGAILADSKAIAVIELKGTDTTDLGTNNTQAFNYKANQSQCVYVVTSNFEKLRFFIDNAVEWIEFDLFNLTEEQFRLLWLCLHRDSLFAGIPKKVKAESVQEEENITKKLYSDYSAFKTALWQDLVKQHPEHDQLLLFKKTQKLLDRFLFVLFSEDKGLLPPNSIREIADQWEKLRDMDAYVPLYARFQKYFGYLNTGHKGKLHDIFAYNGGLFKPDELLDAVRISDEVLHPHLLRISKYDFASEVDVNILGHIFEHSLNEIEAITAQLEGRAVDSKKTKRKKDGVFYTPKYITKYIVENTVGRLCAEKKDELAINDEEYARGRKGRQKKTIQELDTKLDVYRDWLLSLTICDPACGSGAFLNQALDFLIAEHAYVNELEAKLLGQSIVFKDIGDHILERNIYGVDINEESVEIARLSLWLRTATKGRKLNDLSANIKCGNSLIDDPAVAGAKVFDWKKEFPAVFAKGGFDVVIGNPPWGADLNEDDLSFIKARDEDIVVRMIDSFMFFVSAALRISQPEGRLGQIVPDVILYQTDNRKLREKLLRETHLERAINLGDGIFQDVARPSAIVICSKRQSSTARTLVGSVQKNFDDDLESLNLEPVEQSLLLRMPNSMFPTVNLSGYALLSRLNFPKLLSYLDDDGVQRGVSPDLKEAFIVDDRIVETNRLELEYVKSTVTGGVDVRRFGIDNDMKRLLYVSREVDASQIRNIVEYISRFRDKITCTEVSQGKHPFYALHRPRDPAIFEKSGKLVGVITGDRIIVALDASRIYPTDGLYVFSSNGRQLSNKALGCLLNSTLLTYLYRLLSSETGRTMAQVKPVLVEELPIAAPSAKGVEHLEQLHDRIAQDMASLREIQLGVNHLLQSKYTLPTLSRALENWPGLEFKGFLAELKKAKVQLTLAEEAEWLTYFTAEKAKAQTLQAQIAKTDKEIDALVYELYGLTEEEVKVVEGK